MSINSSIGIISYNMFSDHRQTYYSSFNQYELLSLTKFTFFYIKKKFKTL